MHIEQTQLTTSNNWTPHPPGRFSDSADLVLIFGNRLILQETDIVERIASIYESAIIIGCSTAGEISATNVYDDTVVLTAIDFESTHVKASCVNLESFDNSFNAGQHLAQSIPSEGLTHTFVISEGLNVNGSKLVAGLREYLPSNVGITGGLSADGTNFEQTVIIWGKKTHKDAITMIGFYGEHLHVGYGSLGGWDTFGTERLVTRSDGNVLYELDGRSALRLYKEYLGEHASGLPATAVLFPLTIRVPDSENSLVRTILSVDEQQESMTFAGDIPQGSYATLMKANFSRLVDGAMNAAQTCTKALKGSDPELAILISCVGRKMALKQRVEEEVEAVRSVLGDSATLAGFYSYGEISPFDCNTKCELHNQTMTITTFSEN